MNLETLSDTNIHYGLINFDAEGKEMSEQGGLMSQHLVDKVRTDKIATLTHFSAVVRAKIGRLRDTRLVHTTSSGAQRMPYFIGFL